MERGGSGLKVLFWMFIGFDQHATSEHLLSAVVERLCEAGNSVHIIQKNTGGTLPPIPEKLSIYNITTDVIPYQAADKEKPPWTSSSSGRRSSLPCSCR